MVKRKFPLHHTRKCSLLRNVLIVNNFRRVGNFLLIMALITVTCTLIINVLERISKKQVMSSNDIVPTVNNQSVEESTQTTIKIEHTTLKRRIYISQNGANTQPKPAVHKIKPPNGTCMIWGAPFDDNVTHVSISDRLFLYAMAYGIAKKTYHLHVNKDEGLLAVLPYLRTAIDGSDIQPDLVINQTGYSNKFSGELYEKVNAACDVELYQIFPLPQYFQEIEDNLRQNIKLSAFVQQVVEIVLQNYQQQFIKRKRIQPQKPINCVLIHAQDNKPLQTNTLKVILTPIRIKASRKYYKKSIEHFRKKKTDLIFLVVSEDVADAKLLLSMHPNIDVIHWPVNSTDPLWTVYTFQLAKVCNQIITTSGTLSWWLGWLVTGQVVYNVQTIDIVPSVYPKNWLGIDN